VERPAGSPSGHAPWSLPDAIYEQPVVVEKSLICQIVAAE
jgi:hypothetical protein